MIKLFGMTAVGFCFFFFQNHKLLSSLQDLMKEFPHMVVQNMFLAFLDRKWNRSVMPNLEIPLNHSLVC